MSTSWAAPVLAVESMWVQDGSPAVTDTVAASAAAVQRRIGRAPVVVQASSSKQSMGRVAVEPWHTSAVGCSSEAAEQRSSFAALVAAVVAAVEEERRALGRLPHSVTGSGVDSETGSLPESSTQTETERRPPSSLAFGLVAAEAGEPSERETLPELAAVLEQLAQRTEGSLRQARRVRG